MSLLTDFGMAGQLGFQREAAVRVDLDKLLAPDVSGNLSDDLYARAKELLERKLFTYVLEHHKGNQSDAALSLGISRMTLRHRLKELGIEVKRAAVIRSK